MLRIFLFLFFLVPQSLWAGDLWIKACDEDLTQALEIKAHVFRIMHERYGEFQAELPRSLGIVHALCIDELISQSKQLHWGDSIDYRQKFVGELIWVKTLLNKDISEVYRQAKFYRALGGNDDVRVLAIYLNKWAADKKYPPAEFDEVQALFADGPSQLAIGWLKQIAGRGYAPAMLDAARRFLIGDGVARDLGSAYYWVKRAEAAHGDLSGIIEKPYDQLLQQMSAAERKKLLWTSNQFGDLEVRNPLLSFHRLRREDHTKASCKKRLPVASEIIHGMFEHFPQKSGNLDIRLSYNLGVGFGRCIDELTIAVERMDWGRNRKYREKFIEGLQRVRNLLKEEPKTAYRQAKFYKDRNDGELDQILAFRFHHWAVMENYPPAEFDDIQANFAKNAMPRTGVRLKRLANRGYLPAMLDAAKRFLNGDGVEKNLGDAYYWIKRAEAAQGDLSSILGKPYQRLLEEMNEREKKRLEQSLHFYGPFE